MLKVSLLRFIEHSELISELERMRLILGKVSIVEDFECILIMRDDFDICYSYKRNMSFETSIKRYYSEAWRFELCYMQASKS